MVLRCYIELTNPLSFHILSLYINKMKINTILHNQITLPAMWFITCLVCSTTQAATITVNSNNDVALPSNNGDCTLREAIKAAEDDTAVDACSEGAGADTIIFDSSVTSILLEAGDLSRSSNPITKSLTIKGNGVDNLTIDGDDQYRFLYFNSSGANQVFTISDLTVTQMSTSQGAGISIQSNDEVNISNLNFDSNTASRMGGAIFIASTQQALSKTVTISNSSFTNNRAQGAVGRLGGGAIRSSVNTNLNIINSSFLRNISEAQGGAILIDNVVGTTSGSSHINITQSTFSGNETDSTGGGIYFHARETAPGTINISHSTFTLNEAGFLGGGIALATISLTSTLSNTVIANNSAPSSEDLYRSISATTNSNGSNFIGDNDSVETEFPAGSPNVNNDYVGTTADALNPELNALTDNGGATKTHLPLKSSVLIDAGTCPNATTDQRGFGNNKSQKRVIDNEGIVNGVGSDGCDIGAVEVGAELLEPPEESCFAVKTANENTIVFCL